MGRTYIAAVKHQLNISLVSDMDGTKYIFPIYTFQIFTLHRVRIYLIYIHYFSGIENLLRNYQGLIFTIQFSEATLDNSTTIGGVRTHSNICINNNQTIMIYFCHHKKHVYMKFFALHSMKKHVLFFKGCIVYMP